MSHGDQIIVTLPGGLTVDGQRRQRAVLRPLTGREEELMAGMAEGMSTAERVTALLSRCLDRLGPDEINAEQLRSLSVGDRERLLLCLRRATSGERIDCLLNCPSPDCRQRIDVELRTEDLLIDPYDAFPTWHEERFQTGGRDMEVRFRLPTGGDQEAVAGLAAQDPGGAADIILKRCIDRVIDAGGDEVQELDAETGKAVAARMAELDPQAELRLQLKCPACEAPIEVLFDTASYLIAELAASANLLYEEVHTLAWFYHWPESEILGLTARKRRRYIDLIAANLAMADRRDWA